MENELFDTTELLQVLREMGEAVRERYVDSLAKNKRNASGTLSSTVHAEVEVNGMTYEVNLYLQDYWKYIEEGTEPHWPPVDAIMQWIAVKPVIPRPGSDGRVPTQKQLAYLIGRKIAEEGTEGTHDLADVREAILAEYEPRIEAALQNAMLRHIRSWIDMV